VADLRPVALRELPFSQATSSGAEFSGELSAGSQAEPARSCGHDLWILLANRHEFARLASSIRSQMRVVSLCGQTFQLRPSSALATAATSYEGDGRGEGSSQASSGL